MASGMAAMIGMLCNGTQKRVMQTSQSLCLSSQGRDPNVCFMLLFQLHSFHNLKEF